MHSNTVDKTVLNLLFGTVIRINSKMDVMHQTFDHSYRVRAFRVRINGVFHDNGGNITKLK